MYNLRVGIYLLYLSVYNMEPPKSKLYRRISDAGLCAIKTVGERNKGRSATVGRLPGTRRLIMAPRWSSLTKVCYEALTYCLEYIYMYIILVQCLKMVCVCAFGFNKLGQRLASLIYCVYIVCLSCRYHSNQWTVIF